MTTKSKLLNNTIINSTSTLINYAIVFITVPVLLGRSGPEAYGVWQLIGTFGAIGWTSLLGFGVQGSVVKYVAEYKAKKDYEQMLELFNTTLLFFLVVGLVALVLLSVVGGIFLVDILQIPKQYQSIARVLFFVVACMSLFDFLSAGLSAFIEGLQNYVYLRLFSIFFGIITLIYYHFLVKDQNVLLFVALWALIGSVVSVGYQYLAVKSMMPNMYLSVRKMSFDRFRIISSMSAYLFISRMVGLIFNNTDKIIIGFFLSMSAMTNYDVVNKGYLMVVGLSGLLRSAIVPASSELYAQGHFVSLKKMLIWGTKYNLIFILPILLIFMIFAEYFFEIWLGASYVENSNLLRIYLSSIFCTAMTGVGFSMLVGQGEVKSMSFYAVLSAAFNLLFSLLTVKIYGLYGLVMCTVLAYVISTIPMLSVILRSVDVSLNVFVKDALIGPCFLSVLYCTAIYFGRVFMPFNELWLCFLLMAVSVLLFWMLAYIFIMDNEEKNNVRQIIVMLKNR